MVDGSPESDRDYLRTLRGEPSGRHLQRFQQPRLSLAERFAQGKALRQEVPRGSHAAFQPHPDRPDPVAIIAAQNATRIASLVPLRLTRMAASPFGFLRGSAAVMARDLAHSPRTGLEVMACGDMHVGNFGVFASAERRLVFAINDFDEVEIGHWEWDLKQLAASAAVAALTAGCDAAAAAETSFEVRASYVKHMRRYAEMGFLETWYQRIDAGSILETASPRCGVRPNGRSTRHGAADTSTRLAA